MKFAQQFLKLTAMANDVDRTKFRVNIHPRNISAYGEAMPDLAKMGVASFVDVAAAGRFMVVETVEEIETLSNGLPEDE